MSLIVMLASGNASAESDVVGSERKIGAGASGFTGTLDPFDFFGDAVAAIGDLDGDGVGDLAVGATGDDDCGADDVSSCGAVWIVFLRADGTVKGQQKISGTQGGFTGQLVLGDWFGAALTGLGDVDGDGVVDLAVGATCPNNGGCGGAVWILRLNRDGTVKAHTKIGAGLGGFTGILAPRSEFGRALARVGDLDGDGLRDVVVGAPGGSGAGKLWILFLAADGTVRAHLAIDDTTAALAGALEQFDRFGTSVAALGDLDGDGTPDLAVGAEGDDDGGPNRGAVWMLFLKPGGAVGTARKISATAGNFTDPIPDHVQFGRAVAAIGDLDADGVVDLVVSAPGIDDGGLNRGGAWVVFLDASGAVVGQQKISDTAGGFEGDLNAFQVEFGSAAAALGDLDGDGLEDVAIGARGFGDSTADIDAGAVWMLFLDVSRCGRVPRAACIAASRARLRLTRRPGPAGRTLAWRWRETASPALGDPLTRDGYTLCLWDHHDGVPALATSLRVPAGLGWNATSGDAFRYRDRGGAADGVTKIVLDARSPARATVVARGAVVPLPEPVAPDRLFAANPRLTVQLLNDAGACWTSSFTAARHNTATRYDAATP